MEKSLVKWVPGPRLNIKPLFPGMDLNYKDKTVVGPLYLDNENSYTGTLYILRRSPELSQHTSIMHIYQKTHI